MVFSLFNGKGWGVYTYNETGRYKDKERDANVLWSSIRNMFAVIDDEEETEGEDDDVCSKRE
jgi:hypothetical protein